MRAPADDDAGSAPAPPSAVSPDSPGPGGACGPRETCATCGTSEDARAARARVRERLVAGAPETVRARVADLVSTVVGHVPAVELPATVRPIARFAPAKRARAGGAALVAAVGADPDFAERVVAWWAENRSGPGWEPGDDPVTAAAVALLEGRDDGAALAREVGERADAGRLRAERDAALARAERLATELDRAVAERDRAREEVRAAERESRAEITKLRARLRDQGVRVRRAQDEAAEARGSLEAGDGDLRRGLAEAERERDRQRDAAAAAESRARRADEELSTVRRAALEARRADETRLALLVDTLAGAAEGLRRELGLRDDGVGSGPRPADLVGASSGTPTGRAVDAGAFDRLLALPQVHLIVDGYNVTKTGWPELSLAVQRERLVAALAPLVSRTGAETTLVFDGAGVVGVPTASVRGVRVLFSEPGVLADDLIRSLVAAEPAGRALVVVTSDRAVADSVRRRGAHPVPSRVLLARTARI